MKNLLLIFTVFTMVACSSDDDAGNTDPNDFEQIKTILPQGEWEVSKYFDDNVDQTDIFESFVFDFKSDNTVVAQTDLFSENGTWLYDNTSTDEEDLILQFTGTPPFDEISDDWDIISVSSSKIELRDDDDGNEVDLLTFTKL